MTAAPVSGIFAKLFTKNGAFKADYKRVCALSKEQLVNIDVLCSNLSQCGTISVKKTHFSITFLVHVDWLCPSIVIIAPSRVVTCYFVMDIYTFVSYCVCSWMLEMYRV